ncbi:helix-turn-helix transcriptional regulator [Sulfobacillus harzensis]|uniref:YafY family transcriptional regulator n=1 Tax=Sulfobacillus harzensis TaxID=2729629 RepID=A0A7Y0Q4D5_9FIRM|nr:YafY family protein [Sulfobacillus harzensis]NMP23134.1 YafY family transcriptional regulator [Sulfobacillus harzensis]
MRADRLLSIILLLKRHQRLTAGELADRLEVSRRTVMRDIDALSAVGIPIYGIHGKLGGYQLLDGYDLDLKSMSGGELQALLLGGDSHLMGDLGWISQAVSAREKIHRSAPESIGATALLEERIYIDGRPWFSRRTERSILEKVKSAVWENRLLHGRYLKPDGSDSFRLVAPFGLVAKAGIWYVVGESAGNLRVFRLSRFQEVMVLTTTFSRPKDFSLSAFWTGWSSAFERSRPQYPVRVSVNADHAEEFVRTSPWPTRPRVDTPSTSGFVAMTVIYENPESAVHHLMPWGSWIRVETPLTVRNQIANRARDILSVYAAESEP